MTRFKNILALRGDDRIAARVCNPVPKFAAPKDARRDAVTVRSRPERSALRHSGFARPPGAETGLSVAREDARSAGRIEQRRGGFAGRGDRMRRRHLEGLAPETLPDHAQTGAIGTRAMDPAAHTEIAGLFTGDTAGTAQSRVNYSIPTAKPEGCVLPAPVA